MITGDISYPGGRQKTTPLHIPELGCTAPGSGGLTAVGPNKLRLSGVIPTVITGDCDFADVNTNTFMDVHRCIIWIHFGAIPWHIGMFWYIRCYGIQLAP